MKKCEYNDGIGYFDIDPKHLAHGLEEARRTKQTAIRITPLDFRSKNLAFDFELLTGQPWIRKLLLDDDLEPPGEPEDLQRLIGLESLIVKEWAPLDYGAFENLRELNLIEATTLTNVEKLKSLRSLMLVRWKEATLPKSLVKAAATEVVISVSGRLVDASVLFQMQRLDRLSLIGLPKLQVGDKALHLDTLSFLHVESSAWKDFHQLHSKSLEEVELFTKFESLAFIKQLPALEKLYIWECVDGDMTPVLQHPSLKEIYFDKNRKHYSHKEAALQAALESR